MQDASIFESSRVTQSRLACSKEFPSCSLAFKSYPVRDGRLTPSWSLSQRRNDHLLFLVDTQLQIGFNGAYEVVAIESQLVANES